MRSPGGLEEVEMHALSDLREKVAVITGAGRGIGAELGRALAREGAHVMLTDIDPAAAAAVRDTIVEEGGQADSMACDVSDRRSVDQVADIAWSTFGRVDLLVNNAGVGQPYGPLISVAEEDARWVLEVNVLGVWFGCAVFGPRLIEQGSPAHILNVGSETSFGAPVQGTGLYTASKHAVLGLSDVLRHELPDFIGVSVLCPGVVATEFVGGVRSRPRRFGGPGEPTIDRITVGMSPEEVAHRAVAGVRRGDFYIVTHPPVVEIAEERWREIEAAFATQAPRYDGDEALDTRAMLRSAPPP